MVDIWKESIKLHKAVAENQVYILDKVDVGTQMRIEDEFILAVNKLLLKYGLFVKVDLVGELEDGEWHEEPTYLMTLLAKKNGK